MLSCYTTAFLRTNHPRNACDDKVVPRKGEISATHLSTACSRSGYLCTYTSTVLPGSFKRAGVGEQSEFSYTLVSRMRT